MRVRPIGTSFRARLAVAILLASLVPVVSIAAVALTVSRRALEAAAVRLNDRVLEGLAGNLALFAAERSRELEVLARDPRVASLDPARAGPVLRAALVDGSFFHRLELCAPDGTRLAADAPGRVEEGPGPALAAALATARSLDRAQALPLGDGPHPPWAWLVPVRDLAGAGPPRAYLVGSALLHGAEVQERLDAAGVPGDGFVCIVDTAGRVLARRGDGLDPTVLAFTPAARFAAPGPDRGPEPPRVLAEAPGAALVSMVWSPSLSAWILRGEPWDRAFALVRTLGGSFALAVAIALVLAGAAAAWLSHRLGEPIAALAAALGRLEAGVLAVRVEADGEDELADAGRAFNGLAASLQKRALVGAAWEELRREAAPPP